jgi:hypothetical protein
MDELFIVGQSEGSNLFVRGKRSEQGALSVHGNSEIGDLILAQAPESQQQIHRADTTLLKADTTLITADYSL